MNILKYIKFLIFGVLIFLVWSTGLFINFFGWKDLGSNALPLYIRLLIFTISILVFIALTILVEKHKGHLRKTVIYFIPHVMLVVMILTYIWQDYFYNQLDGSAFMVFHPGLVISIGMYCVLIIMNTRLLFTLIKKSNNLISKSNICI